MCSSFNNDDINEVLISHKDCFLWADRYWSSTLEQLREAYDVKKFNPHDTRRLWGHFLEMTKGSKTVASDFKHSSSKVTERYVGKGNFKKRV